jgi:non-homologous end joining protein Ku
LILLEPRAKGIMGTTLHHNYEVRSDSADDLIHSKRAGRPVQVTHVPRPGNVINLMDALRRSLGPEKSTQLEAKKSHPAATKPKPGRRAAARSKTAPSKGRIKKAS